MERSGSFRAGAFLFHAGTPSRVLWVVRTGAVKTSRIDVDGREQVLSFRLPGEVFGWDAIYPGYYPSDAIALERTACCRFSLQAAGALAARYPEIQQQLLRLLSRELNHPNQSRGRFYADERVAAFLLDLAARYARNGYSGTSLTVHMTRRDIGNYLRLAGETVSRVLARFRASGLIAMHGRDIELLDLAPLRRLARCGKQT